MPASKAEMNLGVHATHQQGRVPLLAASAADGKGAAVGFRAACSVGTPWVVSRRGWRARLLPARADRGPFVEPEQGDFVHSSIRLRGLFYLGVLITCYSKTRFNEGERTISPGFY